MRYAAPLLALLICSALTSRPPAHAVQAATPTAAPCGDIGTLQTRTTLYFGLNRKGGNVTEAQWQAFLRDEVTPRFPQGFTVWQADGQWRRADGVIEHEHSKVLRLVHEDTPTQHAALAELIGRYKRAYQQESVLWETGSVCAAF
jgi:Protein of unknown function (DUF3574)